ncbi:MAG: hypothetical protein ACRD16_11710 [Thermoanaerobaculia bacterium]
MPRSNVTDPRRFEDARRREQKVRLHEDGHGADRLVRCPECAGRRPAGCASCEGRGYRWLVERWCD